MNRGIYSANTDVCLAVGDKNMGGCFDQLEIDELITLSRDMAHGIVDSIPSDHVVIYAVLEYIRFTERMINADIMLTVVPYSAFTIFAGALADSSRFYFFRGRKEQNEQ